eukprot:m.235083 g.235083  ORF g.235083 m.235083 type:complete len:596 (-) comp26529_c0_seq1:24-1811(-)
MCCMCWGQAGVRFSHSLSLSHTHSLFYLFVKFVISSRTMHGVATFASVDLSAVRVDSAAAPAPSSSVLIIGAGPCGLTSLKELKEKRQDVTLVECRAKIGGTFAHSYDELMLTSSSLITAFSAYSDGLEAKPKMWTGQEYCAYLAGYCQKFDLFKHIRFNTACTDLEQDQTTGKWRAHLKSWDPQSPSTPATTSVVEYDNVVVASGVNQKPSMPMLKGSEQFQGRILHSHEYRSAKEFTGKNVLLIGVGESGSDIAYHVSKVANTSCLSTRKSPGYVIPREYNGTVTDLDTSRLNHGCARVLLETGALKLKTFTEGFFMSESDDREVLAKASEINEKRGHHWTNRFGTKNTSFVTAMLHHGLQYRESDICHLESDRVVFKNGTSFECDTIICCTGYGVGFSFLEKYHMDLAKQALDARAKFKKIFLPSTGPSLSFIGHIRPAVGSIPPMAEMQARYLAQILSKEKPVPSMDYMLETIAIDSQRDMMHYPEDAGRLSALTDFLTYQESMAELIGCKPRLTDLALSSPATAFKVVAGPLTTAQFRLTGPGADEKAAKEILARTPTVPLAVILVEFLLLLFCKFMSLLGYDKFTPTGF